MLSQEHKDPVDTIDGTNSSSDFINEHEFSTPSVEVISSSHSMQLRSRAGSSSGKSNDSITQTKVFVRVTVNVDKTKSTAPRFSKNTSFWTPRSVALSRPLKQLTFKILKKDILNVVNQHAPFENLNGDDDSSDNNEEQQNMKRRHYEFKILNENHKTPFYIRDSTPTSLYPETALLVPLRSDFSEKEFYQAIKIASFKQVDSTLSLDLWVSMKEIKNEVNTSITTTESESNHLQKRIGGNPKPVSEDVGAIKKRKVQTPLLIPHEQLTLKISVYSLVKKKGDNVYESSAALSKQTPLAIFTLRPQDNRRVEAEYIRMIVGNFFAVKNKAKGNNECPVGQQSSLFIFKKMNDITGMKVVNADELWVYIDDIRKKNMSDEILSLSVSMGKKHEDDTAWSIFRENFDPSNQAHLQEMHIAYRDSVTARMLSENDEGTHLGIMSPDEIGDNTRKRSMKRAAVRSYLPDVDLFLKKLLLAEHSCLYLSMNAKQYAKAKHYLQLRKDQSNGVFIFKRFACSPTDIDPNHTTWPFTIKDIFGKTPGNVFDPHPIPIKFSQREKQIDMETGLPIDNIYDAPANPPSTDELLQKFLIQNTVAAGNRPHPLYSNITEAVPLHSGGQPSMYTLRFCNFEKKVETSVVLWDNDDDFPLNMTVKAYIEKVIQKNDLVSKGLFSTKIETEKFQVERNISRFVLEMMTKCHSRLLLI